MNRELIFNSTLIFLIHNQTFKKHGIGKHITSNFLFISYVEMLNADKTSLSMDRIAILFFPFIYLSFFIDILETRISRIDVGDNLIMVLK